MKDFTVRRFVLGFVATGLLVTTIQVARGESNPLTGVVYTESNIPSANANTVLGFRRDSAGNLTPLPGSPYATGGAGISDPTFSSAILNTDQNVIVNPEHTLLFAVNSGSATIAVFHILPDGSLKAVAGSPFSSGGINPVSLGLADDILYVVNMNTDPQNSPAQAIGTLPNYTGYRVLTNGTLIPIKRSTFEVPAGTSPSQAYISPQGSFLFGADELGGVLRSFGILARGKLLQTFNSPLSLPNSLFAPSGAPAYPLGLYAHPKLSLLYVGLPTINQIATYSFNQHTGALKFLSATPSSGLAPCWLTVNKAGTVLYSSNPFDASVSVYSLANPAAPIEIQKVTIKGFGGTTQLALDEKAVGGPFLQVIAQRGLPTIPEGQGNELHTFTVAPNGQLSEVSSSPIALPDVNGSRPQGVAAF